MDARGPDRRPPAGTGAPLPRHLVGLVVGITALTVLVCAVPLTFAVQRFYHDEAVTELDHFARAMQTTRPDAGADVHVHAAPAVVGLYGPNGRLLVGHGPPVSGAASLCRDGRMHDTVEDGQLTATAPLLHPEGAITVVRVGVPSARVRHQTERAWALIASVAIVLLLLSVAAARLLAGRTAQPIRGLADDTARHLEEALGRERAFSSDVAHQLRTPLTRLLLGLEAAARRPGDPRAAIRTALDRGWSLADTVEDLLRLARDAHARERLDPADLVHEAHRRRDPDVTSAGRRFAVAVHRPLPPVHASPAALIQIMDVLIDNALAHGAGTITVTARRADPGVAVDVMDEGTGPDPDDDVFRRVHPTEAPDGPSPGSDDPDGSHPDGGDPDGGDPDGDVGPRHRIGLALARSLARAEGGDLHLSGFGPTVFTLVLPAALDTAATLGTAVLGADSSGSGLGEHPAALSGHRDVRGA
ncbi:sensor histidine kinase [Actinomadura sp. 9N215]|uniref:sensor histidine kinase n=1 Tax=Actinomadura sp. 9N215 TaxID=3375150 RepID=UPI0037A5E2BE